MSKQKDLSQVSTVGKKVYRSPKRHHLLTTLGFHQITPLFYCHMPSNSSLKTSQKSKGFLFSRANPLVHPIFTNIDYHINNFFVRFKDVWPAWDDYEQHTLHNYPPQTLGGAAATPAIPRQKPFITMANLSDLIIRNSALVTSTTGGQSDIDMYDASTQTSAPYNLTPKGVCAVKLLNNLGIKPTWRTDDNKKVNILSILAFGKIFLDWYYPKSYSKSTPVWFAINSAFTCDSFYVEAAQSGANRAYYDAINCILEYCCYTFYDDSLFYNAWDNPVAPNGVANTAVPNIRIVDPTYGDNGTQGDVMNFNDVANTSSTSPDNGTPFIGHQRTFVPRLTDFAQKALTRASEMIQRFSLAGSAAVDRFLARYGKQLEDSHRAIRLNHYYIPVRIGDVAATADSVNGGYSSVVGDLAGKGLTGQNDIDFNYSNGSHAGIYLSLISCIPESAIVEGNDKVNFYVEDFEDFNPEFDGLAMETVNPCEIATFKDGSCNDGHIHGGSVFGWLKSYYGYLHDVDILSGAFVTPNAGSADLLGYHTFRLFPSMLQSNIVHSLQFMQSNFVDMALFDRIFYNTKSNEQMMFDFKVGVELFSPIKPLYRPLDFEYGDGTVMLDSNGAKVN